MGIYLNRLSKSLNIVYLPTDAFSRQNDIPKVMFVLLLFFPPFLIDFLQKNLPKTKRKYIMALGCGIFLAAMLHLCSC